MSAIQEDTIQRVQLADGRSIACTNPLDQQIWPGLWEDSPYDDGLASLRAGDVIVDVGAHLGLTALYFSDRVPGVRVIAFEPTPDTYACLADNVERLMPNVSAVNLALGAAPGTAELTYYPNHTMMATTVVDDADDEHNMSAVLANFGVNAEAQVQFWRDFRAGMRLYAVRVTTLGDVIDEHGIDEIGLLKIDVERGELAVLRGLRPDQWSRVRQAVVEVHNIGDNLSAVLELLREHGYDTKVFQEPVFAGGSVHIVYASKPGA
jgi:FkbM family methyltransferase